MAEATAIELLTLASVAGNGNGADVAIAGRQNVAQLIVEVTVVDTSITVNVQRRDDASGAYDTTNTITVSTTGKHKISALVGPLTRVTYTATAGDTFGVDGIVETVYCVPEDISEDIVREVAIAELTETRRVNACLRASDEADGYLRSRYTMPVTAWSRDLRLHSAELAAAYLFTYRGTDPNSPDMLIYDARNTAKQWFDRLQAGRIEPDITDSSDPVVYGAGVAVASDARRGW